MADENKEIPEKSDAPQDSLNHQKSPVPSIWDTFAKGRFDKPRDISQEERERAGVNSSLEQVKSIEEMRRGLMKDFIDVIPQGSGSQSFTTPKDKNDEPVHYDVLVGTDPQRKSLLVRREEYPSKDMFSSTDNRYIFEDNGQRYPQIFRGSDGKVYEFLGGYYYLEPNGEDTLRVEYSASDNYNQDIPLITKIPDGLKNENGPREFIKNGLSIQDFEFLGTVLNQIQTHEVVPYSKDSS